MGHIFVKQPSIDLWGLRLEEPITTLTDVWIAMVCIYFYFQLRKIKNDKRELFYLKSFFLGMAFSTAYGGIVGHGLLHYLSWPWKLPAWLTSMIAVAFLERATILHVQNFVNKKGGSFFAVLNIIELLTFMTITLVMLEFRWVEYHSLYGLLFIVGGFSLYALAKINSPVAKWFLVGVVLSMLSGVVFMNQWGLHVWFNHMDVSHMIMSIAAWTFYRGGRHL